MRQVMLSQYAGYRSATHAVLLLSSRLMIPLVAKVRSHCKERGVRSYQSEPVLRLDCQNGQQHGAQHRLWLLAEAPTTAPLFVHPCHRLKHAALAHWA